MYIYDMWCCCVHAPGSRHLPHFLHRLTSPRSEMTASLEQSKSSHVADKHVLLSCYTIFVTQLTTLRQKNFLPRRRAESAVQLVKFPSISLCPWMYAEFQWLGDARRTPSLSDAQQFGPHLSSSGVIDTNWISNISNIWSWILGLWLRCASAKIFGDKDLWNIWPAE